MTLCDTGPMVALIDGGDRDYARCLMALEGLGREQLVTTWPCLTEGMYLLGRNAGPTAQDELWGYLADGLIRLDLPAPGEWARMRALMVQYADAPMDLADASLVVAAERLGVRRVFTLDRHFHAYRADGTEPFEIVP
ncbi:MAG: PIN domain-containing protein [Gemmataceae bacterium]